MLYKDAVRWKQSLPLSEKLGNLPVHECKPAAFEGCDVIFSGLDSSVAGDVGKFAPHMRLSILRDGTLTVRS